MHTYNMRVHVRILYAHAYMRTEGHVVAFYIWSARETIFRVTLQSTGRVCGAPNG